MNIHYFLTFHTNYRESILVANEEERKKASKKEDLTEMPVFMSLLVAYTIFVYYIYQILVGKPQEKRLLGRSRRRWKDNIRMDLREIPWEGVDWMLVAQDRVQWRFVVNMVMKLRVL
jgi:hypothetical protein